MSVYPTLCSLCGLSIPRHVEGEDISSLLADPQARWSRPALTTFRLNNHTVRTEKWRYIRYADGGEELYDHENDEYEWTNLADDSRFAEIKKELSKLFPAMNRPELPRSR
jgi:arylsulfatase A-like enzyme